MQFYALLAAALVATASAATPCALDKLGPVVLGANGSKCTAETGMSFLPPSVPGAAVVPKLCASTACRALLTELKAAAPTECTVSISVPPLDLYAALLTPLEKACGPAAGPAPAPAPAPAAGPAPAPAAGPAPAPAAGPAAGPAPAPAAGPAPAPAKDDSC